MNVQNASVHPGEPRIRTAASQREPAAAILGDPARSSIDAAADRRIASPTNSQSIASSGNCPGVEHKPPRIGVDAGVGRKCNGAGVGVRAADIPQRTPTAHATATEQQRLSRHAQPALQFQGGASAHHRASGGTAKGRRVLNVQRTAGHRRQAGVATAASQRQHPASLLHNGP